MKKIIKKGKVVLAFITVFAILAASIFTGAVVTSSALSCGGTIVEKWDKVSDGVNINDWYDGTFESGDGSKDNPYIISSAEELAWVCKNTTVENSAGVYYKVDESIKAFDMNTVSGVDLTDETLTANEVYDCINGKILGKVWHPGYNGCFAGNFDGSGVTIYGLYAGPAYYNQNSLDTNSPYGCTFGGLFSKIDASKASFKNFSIKNSYFTGDASGAIFGESSITGGSASIENVVVANCYIKSTGGAAGGVLGGYLKYNAGANMADKAKIKNCLVYGNVVENKNGTAARLLGTMEAYCDNGSGTKVRDYNGFGVSNTIAIGCAIENSGSYWQKDSAFYTNCYTTETSATENTTIYKLSSANDAIGEAALTNLKGLDKSVWFFNTTTYPALRAFHKIETQDNGDGTHSEICGCELEGFTTIHTFANGICSGCGYIDPCISGHTLEPVAEIPATKTENGVKAHDYCAVCEKTFIDGSVVLASDLIIPMLVTTSSFTGNLDNELLGSGTKKDPYLITSADEFAAVALGKVSSVDSEGNQYYFEVLDSLQTLYINGGEQLAKMTDIEDVKDYLTTNSVLNWTSVGEFGGYFDGNGVTVYGVYSNNPQAGLFPKVSGHVSIKNIALKNSYLITPENNYNYYNVGGIVGYSPWKSDSSQYGTIEIESCVVANNYIHSQSSDKDYGRAGAVVGNIFSNSVTINNCAIYDNQLINGSNTSSYAPGLVAYASGGKSAFSNIVSIGTNPYTAGGGWHLRDNSKFTNVYTDGVITTAEGAPADYTTIKRVEKDQAIASAAKENITLDENIWFYNTTSYPQIRVFHDISGESAGVDGHKNEKDECCGLEILLEGIIPHSYVGNSCTVCGYMFPCTYGHNFTDVPSKDASYEEAGNIAHKYCSQCDKKYPMDAAIDEPITSAYTDADVIIPQMLPYDEWDGTYASYFWMNNEGDGSAGNPFIVHSAEQLAAVATGNLKYDASKPTSANFNISKYTLSGNLLDTTDLTFKVRDGLNYFYINGGEELSKLDNAEDVKNYFESNIANNWIKFSKFSGTFNGNGAIIYGVYSVNNDAVGLFPLVDSKTSIKNVILKNSYIKTSEGNHNSITAGGLFGRAQWYTDSTLFATLNVRSCFVANNYICSQNADTSYGRVGAIAGNLFSNGIVIRDTLVYGNILVNGSGIPTEYKSGLVAAAGSGSSAFKNVVSIDTPPYTAGGGWHLYDNSKFTNVYTDCAITIADGAAQDYKKITKLTKEQMTGDKAKENMPELDWVQFWITNDGEYPTPRIVNIKDYASGLAWTGDIAKEFPSGDGSMSNPYIIPAPEYLALMLTTDNDGLYYKLTADIIINDTSIENWKDTAKVWFTSENIDAFKGNLNGNGFTISGLYYSDIDAGVSAGLIPVADSATINNITVTDSYLAGSPNAYIGSVIGSVVDSCLKPISLQGITIEDSVVTDDTATIGGVIGKAGESVVRITNSISKSGGFIGISSNGVSIKNSVSVNAAPVVEDNGAQFKNVYTNVDTTLEGVAVLADSDMKGDAAATNMSALDFENVWTTVSDGYPALAGAINSIDGVMGEVWSGNVAGNYAGGDGSVENPYLIATPEQLALCVTKHAHGKHYKLIADIYLNDINSPYWDIKVGCNQWYHNKSGASWGLFKNGGSFDGDGHIVYGLYYERTGFMEANQGAYLGLFPTVGQKALIQNVGISHAYIAGSTEYYSNSDEGKWFSESAGALVGSFVRWDVSYKDELKSDFTAKTLTKDPKFWDNMPIVKNCLVDHTCYIAATYAGGVFGYCDEPFRAYDCIFTGSLKGLYIEHTGGISGQDTANGAYYYNCVSLPQTCDRPYGGWANSNWRTNEAQFCTTVVDSYYFSKYRRVNSGEQIANPSDRVGEAAKAAMPLLDWENTWMVIEDGTPIQQIFAKHHTAEEYTELSDKAFLAPYVTVSFFTDTNEVVVEEMVGRMYSPIELPTVSRDGYTFTGWYVFDDLSIEYPLDYFPPRDIQLYAGWHIDGIAQNFEDYSDTIFDYSADNWRLNKPGAKGGYKSAYVRNGGKSMRLLDTNTDFADFLINYDDMLKIGQTYKITFWVATDKADNPDTILKLVHNEYPEFNKSNAGVEEMVTVTGLTVGQWTQYSYEFTARTPWISMRAGADSSLYFDDILISETGTKVSTDKLAEYLSKLDPDGGVVGDDSSVSPETGRNVTVTILVSVILSCAVIVLVSKKNLVEVIENK